MTNPAISSGRTSIREPLYARPIGERPVATMTASVTIASSAWRHGKATRPAAPTRPEPVVGARPTHVDDLTRYLSLAGNRPTRLRPAPLRCIRPTMAPSSTPLVTWSDRPGEHTRADQSSSRVTVSHRECLAPLLDQCPDHLSEIVGPEGLRHEHVGPGVGCLHQVLIPDVCRQNQHRYGYGLGV